MAEEKSVRREKRNEKDRARTRAKKEKNTVEICNNLIIVSSYNFLLEVIQPYVFLGRLRALLHEIGNNFIRNTVA